MKLKSFYQEIIKKGIDADVRPKKTIDAALKKRKKEYGKLTKDKKRFFDTDSLFNPFADTRILNGSPQSNIKSIIVGIDIGGSELLVVDRLAAKGKKIDLVVSHHPAGRAYAGFYEVMDLQVDVLVHQGISLSASERKLSKRKAEVARRVHSANHERTTDIAKLLGVNFLCMHTPCDNLAYQYMQRLMNKEKPKTLGKIIDLLYAIDEYRQAASQNNPPRITIGSKSAKVSKIHLEFTGGTEGPKDIYERLSACGVDTIIAMHMSEEHHKQCKEANINAIFASHIASDSLGTNLMLDYLSAKEKLTIDEFSGFRRVKRRK